MFEVPDVISFPLHGLSSQFRRDRLRVSQFVEMRFGQPRSNGERPVGKTLRAIRC